MAESSFKVEYRGLCMKAGERMPLPKHPGNLRIIPTSGCDAVIEIGDAVLSIKEQEITVCSGGTLTVMAGFLAAELYYEAFLVF